jgi:hypothetical protein
VEKRRWRARTPRPVGTSVAACEREASWSAECQFRLGRETGAFAHFEEFEEFCLISDVPSKRRLIWTEAGGLAKGRGENQK